MSNYLSGLITMGYLVAGLFFLRFCWRTRDSLFGVFAAAFWMLAIEQAILTWAEVPREEQSSVYLLRLTAFLLIIAAILFKNSRARKL